MYHIFSPLIFGHFKIEYLFLLSNSGEIIFTLFREKYVKNFPYLLISVKYSFLFGFYLGKIYYIFPHCNFSLIFPLHWLNALNFPDYLSSMKVPIRGNYIKNFPYFFKNSLPLHAIHCKWLVHTLKYWAARFLCYFMFKKICCARATRYSMKIGGKKWSEILGGGGKKIIISQNIYPCNNMNI